MFEVIISLPSCLYNHLTEEAALHSWGLWHKQKCFKSLFLSSGGREVQMTIKKETSDSVSEEVYDDDDGAPWTV